MIKIAILFLLTFNAWAYDVDANLLQLKSDNYLVVERMYQKLETEVINNNVINFCQQANFNFTELYKVFEDDFRLINHLRDFHDEYLSSYAQHLDENSRSDLFSMAIFIDSCQDPAQIDLSQYQQTFQYIFMNHNYLKMVHQQFIDSLRTSSF
jgi:hypothetical protein